MKYKRSFSIVLNLWLISIAVLPQTYKFKNYDREQGICNSFIYTINQDKNGYLWIGTGEGLCRFDGFIFRGDLLADSVAPGFVTTSFKDQNGNLWFGFNDGNVVEYDGKDFRLLNTRRFTSGNINRILADHEGTIFIATQSNGLIKELADQKDSLLKVDFPHLIYSMEVNGWDILLGTSEGLYIYRQVGHTGPVELIMEVPEFNGTRVSFISRTLDGKAFWIGTDENVFLLEMAEGERTPKVMNLTGELKLGRMNIQSVTEDKYGFLWVSTFGSGVYRFNVDAGTKRLNNLVHFDQQNGLTARNVKEVFEDMEGNTWFATFGNGLTLMADEAFALFTLPLEGLRNNIVSLCPDENGVWVGGENGLAYYTSLNKSEYRIYTQAQGLPRDEISAVYKDIHGNIWAGTSRSGLYWMPAGLKTFKNFFTSENSLENIIRSITGDKQNLWFATRNGAFRVNLASRKMDHFTSGNGLPHNDINQVFLDSQGNAWIATSSNTQFKIDPSGTVDIGIEFKTQLRGLAFQSLTVDKDGDFWGVTNSSGVFYFAKDSVYNLTRNEGLLSNYCYSLLADNQGNIWVGHRSGFSRINKKNLRISTYSTSFGVAGDCNPNAMALQANGCVLIGTTQGLFRFDPTMEKGNITAPFPNIVSLLVSDNPMDFTREILLPYNIYKLRIDFIGLNYRNPEKVVYRYKLENYDLEWSEPSSNPVAMYSRVADGRYTFLLKTCNSDGVWNEQPLALSIHVKKPVWKQWWFIITSSLIVISIFITIVKIRERNQKKLQEYLETELAARTKEVIEQKEELEVKNREITDSINYAQRIQASILPPVRRMQEFFPGSFIFYQPRDIVSGDFYWFDKLDEDKFLIVCADSTGHGVPGAFMSMIGATLIKDLTARNEVVSPAQLLSTLDAEISGTLNQHIDAERSSDGMDITVCEINMRTHHLRFASAMRPIIISHNRELLYIRGNRSSIGGELYDSKMFIDQEFQLVKGDRIYMFSDGYPDQFGGPHGKKFKMVRLKELLEKLQDSSIDEQYIQIRDSFNEWKGDYAQVDDVLFMAIQV